MTAAAPEARATAEELGWLVSLQTAYWRHHRPLTGTALQQALREWNDQGISSFVVAVRGRQVKLWEKHKPSVFSDHDRHVRLAYIKRARMYEAFFQKALRQAQADLTLDFALDVADEAHEHADLPIFSFQKPQGACNPLIPDVDFFHSKWYLDERDALSYEQKTVSACFVGSSTGGKLTVESIHQAQTPRLRAATYFAGHPRITFRIAKAVQCLTDEARQHLMAQPYFSEYVSWKDQLQNRFILSMDGNGAACSRLVKGLRSNSVVVKYYSPHELYYFPALRPGEHYLLADNDQDAERFVDSELASPGAFKQIPANGHAFADKYLTVRSVVDYTVQLLTEFAALQRH